MNIFIIITLYILVLLLSESAKKYLGISQLAARKISHTLGAVVTFLLPYFISYQTAVILGLLFFFIICISRKYMILKSIHDKDNRNYGEIFFPLGLIISGLFIWPLSVHAYQGSALILGISDGFAGYFGYRFGKHRYQTLGGWKTYEGTLIFLIITLSIMLIYANLFSRHSSGVKFSGAVVSAVIITITESLFSKGTDNLMIPFASGLLLLLLL